MTENDQLMSQSTLIQETKEESPFITEADKAMKPKSPEAELKDPQVVVTKSKSVIDYAFYLLQRGEVGHIPTKQHPNGYHERWYDDGDGNLTIGVGSVKGEKNAVRSDVEKQANKTGKITKSGAVSWSQDEMRAKIREKCLEHFPNFDKMLPCYQAAIIDASYHGGLYKRLLPLNDGNALAARKDFIRNEKNHERSAVRWRVMTMGIEIERYRAKYPEAKPKEVATLIANDFIENDKHETNEDCKLTRDELALLYHSCNAAYGVPTDDLEVEAFALSFDNVKIGPFGIGSKSQPDNYSHYSDKPVIDATNDTGISRQEEKVLVKPMTLTLNDKTADLNWLFNYSVDPAPVVAEQESLSVRTTLTKPVQDDYVIDLSSAETTHTEITLKHNYLEHPELKNLAQYEDKPTPQESEAQTIAGHLKTAGTDITESVTTATNQANDVSQTVSGASLQPIADESLSQTQATQETQPTTIEQPSSVLSETPVATPSSVSNTIKASAEASVDYITPSELSKLPSDTKAPTLPKSKSRKGR